MSGPDPSELWEKVLEWLHVAGSDQRAARICLAAVPPLPGVAAYHCQQAIEKLLKGFLVRSNTDFGKTHDLDELGQSVLAIYPVAAPFVTPARDWTAWSVVYRYPGETVPIPEPSIEELTRALDLIANLANMLRSLGPPADHDHHGD
ncbi:MAG: HEPN domain-containing protein [Acetobacteraceae bacterium]|jgi:HEPN domain-containing protein